MIMIKICTKCKIEKSLDEFDNQKGKPFGKRSHCKSCRANEYKRLSESYPYMEKRREYNREYARNHVRERKDYYERNRDYLCKVARENWIKNKDRNSKNAREYYLKHRERLIKRASINGEKRRARLNGAEINDFTEKEWLELLEENNYSCFYCGRADLGLHKDHMIPIARGGDHTKSNIVPACPPCNWQKNKKTAEEYFEWLEFKEKTTSIVGPSS